MAWNLLHNTHFKRSAALAARFTLTAILATGIALSRPLRPTAMSSTTRARPGVLRSGSPSPGSTSSLFTYRRDDASPHGVTRVRIDARRTAAAPIHPELFGNFIEHLGGVVYGGLWAQVLLNPNLEATEKPSGGLPAPPEWQVNRLALWRPGGKELHGFHSPGYVALLPATGLDFTPGALAQTVTLPTHRIRTYAGSIAVRAPSDVDNSSDKAPLSARVRISLASAGSQTWLLAETTVDAVSADWHVVSFHLTLSDGALAKGASAHFTIENAGDTAVDVDRVELFPTDNVGGVDSDVLARAQEWHIPILRWPGGNFASGYHWHDGIGDRSWRPTRRNAAWGGVEPNEFGTDEFLAFCRRLGARAQLTVNAGDGAPEEAAAWVRYCNSGQDDRYGRLRCAIGHRKPYNVRLWEVGNELYGDWQIGHTVPEANALRFVRFRTAMLEADPDLLFIATGKGDEFSTVGLSRNSAWNEALLRASVANGGRPPDFLSIHPLVPLPADLGGMSYSRQYESAMAHPTFLDRTLIPDLWGQIRRITGQLTTTRIALTEWGLIVGGPHWQDGPNHDTVAGAVYNALCLNAMLRQSDRVTLANMTAFMHGGGIKKPNGVVIVDPQYYTQQLYSCANLQTPVATDSVGPGADVSARGYLPAVSDVPDVDLFAALDHTGRRLVLYAVNRQESQPRTVEVQVDGFTSSRADATVLDGPSAKTRNTVAEPDACAPRASPVSLAIRDASQAFSATLPPHSVSMIVLHRR